MLSIRRLLLFCGIFYIVEGARECPELTKPHLTRCDMYYRCTVTPSDTIVWVPKNCPNGLVYDATYRNCVMPGDDWECQLESESSSSRADEENVYGVNNLSYLKTQIRGYDTDADQVSANEDEEQEPEQEQEQEREPEDDQENVIITMSNNGTMTFQSKPNSNSSGNEIESSGDGEDPDDIDLEDKSSYIPIPNNADKLVSAQLQRLSQLIKTSNNDADDISGLSPDDLNQFLALHKLKVKKYHSNKNTVPVPHNKLIDEHHLQQILDLQKKLNNLANNRDAYSTPAPPFKYTVANGYYPASATTVHIKATNGLKNPNFPNVGSASSQIVVNRPGGSVVFRLPYSNPPPQKSNDKNTDSHVSADTLKMILELSKHMSNQAPNTPQFVHTAPASSYAQPVQPIVQPILYNLPWERLTSSSLLAYMNSMNSLKSNKFPTDQSESMEKISSMTGSIPTAANTANEPDDSGPTTIIHNHIPITVSNPSPTNSIVNRIQSPSTTMSPISNEKYDSYGNKRPTEQTNLNDYYSYPPFSENIQQKPLVTHLSTVDSTAPTYSAPSYSTTYSSPYSTQQTSYEPQYIKIAQSQPDRYIPQYSSNIVMHNAMAPIPTYVSVNGGYTNKVYSTYAPQPHLSDGNINEYVHVDHKPYPTLRPVNYVPIATASSATPTYASLPNTYLNVQKQPQIFDKVDHFDDSNEPIEKDNGESNENYSNSNEDYVNSNVEQNPNDDTNENVMNLLADYKSQVKPSLKTTTISAENSAEKKSTYQLKSVHGQNQNQKHKQFVSMNGNFLSMETYQQSIEPFLEKGPMHDLQIEVLTCATGVRQANSSDCTRYFVCNEKTGKILSYKCPPYTAFNADIKICNGDTYAKCFSSGISSEDVLSNDKNWHKKIQQQIIEANRIKAEAHKTQQYGQLIKLQTDNILNSSHHVRNKLQVGSGAKSTSSVVPPTRPAQIAKKRPHRKPQLNTSNSVTKQNQPVQSTQTTNNKFRGKRKIPCKQEGKLVDNLSARHYFLCFKDQTNTMRARRLQCPAKLNFCPSSLVCTANERCLRKNL